MPRLWILLVFGRWGGRQAGGPLPFTLVNMRKTAVRTRQQRKRFLLWALLVLVVAACVFASIKPIARFIAVDRCLDSGGRWNVAIEACER